MRSSVALPGYAYSARKGQSAGVLILRQVPAWYLAVQSFTQSLVRVLAKADAALQRAGYL
jgi:hypothetical protein